MSADLPVYNIGRQSFQTYDIILTNSDDKVRLPNQNTLAQHSAIAKRMYSFIKGIHNTPSQCVAENFQHVPTLHVLKFSKPDNVAAVYSKIVALHYVIFIGVGSSAGIGLRQPLSSPAHTTYWFDSAWQYNLHNRRTTSRHLNLSYKPAGEITGTQAACPHPVDFIAMEFIACST